MEEFLKKLSDKERKLFYATVAVVFIALVDRLMVGPAFAKIRNLDEEITRQERSIVNDQRILNHKKMIIEQNKVFRKYLVDELPDDDVVTAQFLQTIEAFATQTNISLVRSNPGQITKKRRYAQYYATLDCTGFLEDILSFMYLVNTSDDLLKIVRFNMAPRAKDSAELAVSMTIAKMVVSANAMLEEETQTP